MIAALCGMTDLMHTQIRSYVLATLYIVVQHVIVHMHNCY